MGKKKAALVASVAPQVKAVASGASSSKGQQTAPCEYMTGSLPAVSASPSYSISGAVRTVGNASITVMLNPGARSIVAERNYRFDNLPPGTYAVSVSAADFVSTHGDATVDAPSFTIDLQQDETVNFTQTVSIQGHVEGVNEEEIPYITIELNERSVSLQQDLSYSFQGVALGTVCKLIPKRDGWKFLPLGNLKTTDGKVSFTLREPRRIDFELQTFKIQGKLAGMARPKEKGITMQVLSGPRTSAGVVDNLGNYTIDHLPPGSYRFGPNLDDIIFEPADREIDLAADIGEQDFSVKTFNVDFEVSGIPQKLIERVEAKVVISTAGLRGNPIANVKLQEKFEGVVNGVRTFSATATVAGIPAGRNYTASLEHSGFLDVSLAGAPGTPRAVFDLTGNQTVKFTALLKKFKIEGTCLMINGAGKPNITLRLSLDRNVLHTTVSDANGHYVFPVVDAGREYVVTPDATPSLIGTTFDAWSKSTEFLTGDKILDFTSGVSLQWANNTPYLATPKGNAFLTKHAMEGIQQTRRGGNQEGHTFLLHVYQDAIVATWDSEPVENTPPTSAYLTQASDGRGKVRVVRLLPDSPNTRKIHTCYYTK